MASNNLQDAVEAVENVDMSHPRESALMKLATAFPNHLGEIGEVLSIQKYINEKKSQWKKEAKSELASDAGAAHVGQLFDSPEEFGFESHEAIGKAIGNKTSQIKQSTGIVDAKQNLADIIVQDLEKIL